VKELKSTVTGKSFQQLTMTYIVSGGALNSTHLLTRSLKNFDRTSAEQRF